MNYGPEKRCAMCKQTLPIEQFWQNKRGQRHSYCKECHKVYCYLHYTKQVQARMLGA